MRIMGIELIRIFAIMGVILLHTNPFGGAYFEGDRVLLGLSIFINSMSRFAIPFFFVTSGYFFGLRLEKGAGPLKLLRRRSVKLIVLFLAFSLFYGIVNSILLKIPAERMLFLTMKDPLSFILNGTELHLWFLPALVAGLCVPVLFIILRVERYYIPFACLVFAFGLAAGPYHKMLGIGLDIDTKNGLFFSTLFIAIGLRAAKEQRLPGKRLSAGLIASGLVLQLGEGFFLWRYYGIEMITHDYLLGTLLLGTGAFFLALNLKSLRLPRVIEQFGRLTLGIYLVHVVVFRFVYYLLVESGLSVFACQFIFPVAVYLLSALITYFALCLLARLGRGRNRNKLMLSTL